MNSRIPVRPGHYQLKSTIGQDVEKIIRIIGLDPEDPLIWIAMDGEKFTDHDLQTKYVPYHAIAYNGDKQTNTNHTKSKIFQGLKNSDEITIPNTPPTVIRNEATQLSMFQEETLKLEQKPINNNTPNPVKTSLEEEILSKCLIVNINKDNFEKHGIETEVKPAFLNIDFNVDIPYDIERLKKTSKLLDLDVKKISQVLTNHILQYDIRNLIEYKVRMLLLEDDYDVVQNIPNKVIENQTITELNSIEENDKTDIEEIWSDEDKEALYNFLNLNII